MQKFPVWSIKDVSATLPQRKTDSHKGTYGTVLLLAGSPGMPGAAILAAKAAMRSGPGKLMIGTAKESILPIVSAVPEATFEPELLERMNDSELDLNDYKAIAMGPGMLPDQKTEDAVKRLLKMDIPLVLDAGALSQREYPHGKTPIILTPHPGEFSRITGVAVEELEKQREQHATKWAKKLGATIVLKGASTVISFPDGKTYVNQTGNSSLAKGGTGDTLTGMLLGMLCCHDDWRHAVLNAVHLHGACADEWVKTRSPHTLLAHELTDLLPTVLKSYEQ